MTEASRADLDALIVSTLGESVAAQVTRYPSGAVSVQLRSADHWVTVQGVASGDQWGVSVNIAEGDGWTGHDHVFATVEQALRAVRELLDVDMKP